MLPIQSFVEDTINVAPPLVAVGPNPAPVGYAPSNFSNLQNALTHTTLTLLTAATQGPNNKVMMLHQNTNANRAIVVLEAAAGADKTAVLARFWMDGSHPTNTTGLPLKDMGVFEIVGSVNIQNFRVITADDRPHVLQVQYIS